MVLSSYHEYPMMLVLPINDEFVMLYPENYDIQEISYPSPMDLPVFLYPSISSLQKHPKFIATQSLSQLDLTFQEELIATAEGPGPKSRLLLAVVLVRQIQLVRGAHVA